MLSSQLFQLFSRVHGSKRRRALCTVQRDVVFGPFCDELGVHGDERRGGRSGRIGDEEG